MRTTKSYTFSVPLAVADGLENDPKREGASHSEHITSIVMNYLEKAGLLPEPIMRERKLLRELRDEAIEKMWDIEREGGLDSAITLKTFHACALDDAWLAKYKEYIQDDQAYRTGNPRKTNANQTIGSRIKSVLGADDLLDENGRPLRARALKEIIQTYQLLKV